MIRRAMMLGFCAVAFWGGMQLQAVRVAAACAEAGGTMRGERLCTGVTP